MASLNSTKRLEMTRERTAARRLPRITLAQAAGWIFIATWVILTLFPIYWIARMAFSTQKMLLASPTSLLPVEFTIDAFKRVLGLLPLQTVLDQGGSPKVMHFGQYFATTMVVSVIGTIGATVFNAMAAYAFARLRFPYRNQLFYLYIIVQIMPSVLGLIPNFMLIQSAGWVGTLQGIIAPGFLGNAFGVFFFRQYFLGLNRELEEAAMLDGDSLIGIFWHVILPISIPAVSTMFILSFMGSWNELQWAYFAGGSGRIEASTTLTVAMLAFRSQTQTGLPDYTGLMAGTLISVLPMLGLFLIFGRRIVDSIQFQGYR